MAQLQGKSSKPLPGPLVSLLSCTRCHPCSFLKTTGLPCWQTCSAARRQVGGGISSDTASGRLQPRTGLSVTRAGEVGPGWGALPGKCCRWEVQAQARARH